jgi:hypothetical protein
MKDMSNSSPPSLWAWVPVGLLSAMFLGLGTLTYIAVSDPHFALEPDYYDKAVHWDRAQALARESASTGLKVTVDRLIRSSDGSVALRLRLVDRDARPVVGASVAVEAFPNAFANRVERLALSEVAPGVYVGRLPRAVLGVWELRLTATSGTLRFRQVVRQDVTKGDAA